MRPSTRLESSTSYKINTESISSEDTLYVEIYYEKDIYTILFKYEFSGKDLVNKKSIHFKALKSETSWIITWSGANPVRQLI